MRRGTGASRFLIGLVTCFATHDGIPAVACAKWRRCCAAAGLLVTAGAAEWFAPPPGDAWRWPERSPGQPPQVRRPDGALDHQPGQARAPRSPAVAAGHARSRPRMTRGLTR